MLTNLMKIRYSSEYLCLLEPMPSDDLSFTEGRPVDTIYKWHIEDILAQPLCGLPTNQKFYVISAFGF